LRKSSDLRDDFIYLLYGARFVGEEVWPLSHPTENNRRLTGGEWTDRTVCDKLTGPFVTSKIGTKTTAYKHIKKPIYKISEKSYHPEEEKNFFTC